MERKIIFAVLGCVLFFGSTFSQTVIRGKVVDEQSGKAIINAKVGIERQGVGVRSTATGSFSYLKYHEVLENSDNLIIQAKGYEPLEVRIKDIRELLNKPITFSLQKDRISPSVHKEMSKEATLFFDVSYAMAERDVEDEVALLTYFIEEREVERLNVITFSSSVKEIKEYAAPVENIDRISRFLNDQQYDGVSNYDVIDNRESGLTILSTNGMGVLGTATITSENSVYVISSETNSRDDNWIHKLLEFTDGARLTQFYSDKPEESSNSPHILKGYVSSPNGPLQNVNIHIKGSMDAFKTDADGSFAIPAKEGDVVHFTFLGMYPKVVPIENDDLLTIEMAPNSDLLDEVRLYGKNETAKEKENIITAYGREERDRLGYAANFITKKDITPAMIDLSDVLRGKFAGVQVFGRGGDARFKLRGAATTAPEISTTSSNIMNPSKYENPRGPLFVINNSSGTRTPPTWLPISQIESITILKSLSAVNIYGTQGHDGVILINTISSVPLKGDKTAKTDLLVKGNNYVEHIEQLDFNTSSLPSYFTKVSNDAVQEQFNHYHKLKRSFGNDLEFYLDSAKYFSTRDRELAGQILDDLTFKASNNVQVLRMVAFMHEELDNTGNALDTYKRITKLAPQSSQSYRDLARAYKNDKQYNKALELYINMLGDQIKGVDFSGLETTLRREFRHLITLYKDKIDFERLPNEWLDPNFDIDARIVVEWTETLVPFEFQFVGPNKKYYKWSHTLEENKQEIVQENRQGYFTKEFIVDDAPPGEWIVNVKYLGKPGDYVIPPYLRYTIYKNYGTKEETKETKILKLFEQQEKVTIDKLKI